jgi:hypothetical protein
LTEAVAAAAFAALAVPMTASAQDAPPAQDEQQDGENEIIVSGIRASLAGALEAKRDAP